MRHVPRERVRGLGSVADALDDAAGRERALYGNDLDQSAILASLSLGKPHEQAVAAATLAAHRRRAAAPRLVPVLSNEIQLVRYFARDALETMLGAPFPWDVGGPDAERPSRVREWVSAHVAAAPPSGP